MPPAPSDRPTVGVLGFVRSALLDCRVTRGEGGRQEKWMGREREGSKEGMTSRSFPSGNFSPGGCCCRTPTNRKAAIYGRGRTSFAVPFALRSQCTSPPYHAMLLDASQSSRSQSRRADGLLGWLTPLSPPLPCPWSILSLSSLPPPPFPFPPS